jgi:hypothetical protein
MTFTILLALSGLTLSAVAIYYSVIGLTAIFAAAFWPIVVMGTTLEVSKLVAASWLKANWERIPFLMKTYMMVAVVVLMLITSMGIFGFLSKAHLDQGVPTGDIAAKVELLDEKIKTQRDNIDASRKALAQLDAQVNERLTRSTDDRGAERAVQIRRQQAQERTRLQNDISKAQTEITKLNEERAPVASELRKVEAEVGPIKYIAAMIYGDNPDANLLEKAVTWVIMVIVFVFDPLAVLLLLASQMTWVWYRKDKELSDTPDPYVADVGKKPTEEELKDDFLPTYEEITPKAEGDSLTTESDQNIVKEATVAERIEPQLRLDPHQVGWMYPKRANIVDYKVADDTSDEFDKDDLPAQVGLEAWNKMIEEAEQAAREEKDLSEKMARHNWKEQNPNDTLKHQEKLHDLGLIDQLPWESVEKIEDEKLDAEESKKKTYMIKKQNHQLKRTTTDE